MATMTAAEKRAQAKIEYDAFLASCPSRQLLDRISDKWVTLVLAALATNVSQAADSDSPAAPQPMRYSELSRRLAGVSQKMLTQTLRSLEADGLVSRTVVASVPVTVTYQLTELGLSLQNVMLRFKEWAEEHMDEVLAHRRAAEAGASKQN
jgi:DNA-binding HxlR family transcriptional regulator